MNASLQLVDLAIYQLALDIDEYLWNGKLVSLEESDSLLEKLKVLHFKFNV